LICYKLWSNMLRTTSAQFAGSRRSIADAAAGGPCHTDPMADPATSIATAIAALETQRAILGSVVVDAALALRRIAESRMTTVIVVIDDLHWADSGSMDLARHMLAHQRDMPLLCFFLTRPTLFERAPGWAGVAYRLTPTEPALPRTSGIDMHQEVCLL
jgi:hypothetical protein